MYRDISSVGVMCLLSIIKYHKGYEDPAYLLSACRTTNGITQLSDLAKVAETIGLSTTIGNDWGEYDFVVCYGFNGMLFLVGVPNWGLMEFREVEVDVLWESRVILYLEPTGSFKKKSLF